MSEEGRFYRLVGQNIAKARRKHLMSQEKLALTLGLTRTSITNIERGRQRLLVHTLARIASTLDTSFDDLLPQADAKGFADKIPKSLNPATRLWVKKIGSSLIQENSDGPSLHNRQDESKRPPPPSGNQVAPRSR